MAGDPRDTPAMQQYYRFKREHPGCLLLLRIGDFYEAFDEDAVLLSRSLGLTLTKRTEGLPMAGMPHHQLEVYLKRLIGQGIKVAVGDQVEEASQAKGVIRREVTRVATPGTIVEEALVEEDASVTVAAVAFLGAGEDSAAAMAVVEASTGDFLVMEMAAEGVIDELARRRVREVLFAPAADGVTAPPRVRRVLEALGVPGTPRPTWHFRMEEAREAVHSHFGVTTVSGFGLGDADAVIVPAGVVLRYLRETQTPGSGNGATPRGALSPRATLAHLRPPRREDASGACQIDAVSLRALEVERVLRQGMGGATVVDRSLVGIFLGTGKACVCKTAMGKRLLRDWLCRPLADLKAIQARQSAVSLFVSDRRVADELGSGLEGVQDVARIAGRLALDRATPRDLVALGDSIGRAGLIAAPIAEAPAVAVLRAEIVRLAGALTPLAKEIAGTCVEAPPAHLRDGGLIRDGVDAQLDEARLLQKDAGAWLAAYQERLAKELALPGIKVGYNRVFGYYIELTAVQSRNAAEAASKLERKQSLKNAERFTTPELREFEKKVTTAEGRALDRERQLFAKLCDRCREHLGDMQRYARAVAELDVLLGFAARAAARGWVKPEMVAEPVLEIEQGRHPVLEEILGNDFVPNDVTLNTAGLPVGVAGRIRSGGEADKPGTLALITGPNMAGKSTFIRQVALIVLLAHAGSFVPATRATIGLTDRIFTRIGADDALHAGQSTFMVEMTETANILNNATERSLVVLDEIGRGTSTLDGLSLAWAIAEFLAGDQERAGPRTLFATHYHELTDLEERMPGRVKNLHVAVREWTTPEGVHEIVFLHRILPGRTDQSYGVHVARLAGIPAPVIGRAREVLESLAVQHGPLTGPATPPHSRSSAQSRPEPAPADGQMMLFTQYLPHPALDQLREVKMDTLSPMQAFEVLRELRERAMKP